jgi:integrase
VGPTKSGRERKVPMTGALERALRSLRHLRSQLVFCDGDGKPLKIDWLHERLWTALRRAGLRRIRWYDLRRTFASQLMMAGVPIRQVQVRISDHRERRDRRIVNAGIGPS